MAIGPKSVMASKRVHGPSARYTLLTHMRNEKCSTKGCTNPPLYTRNESGIRKVRVCLPCAKGEKPGSRKMVEEAAHYH